MQDIQNIKLKKLCDQEILEKLDSGVYQFMIYSNETALYLHNLCD